MNRSDPLALATGTHAFASASPAQVRQISDGGHQISYAASGSGEVTLVLIHGGFCDRSFWFAQAGLGNDWPVIAVDLAGHGASSDAGLDDILTTMAADVARVVADAGAERVILVGHSFGALVALETGRLIPGKVAGVVVVDMLHDGRMTPPPRPPLGPGGMRGAMRAGMFKPAADVATRERILDTMLAVPPAQMMPLQLAALAFDAEGTLRALTAIPLTMIFGGMRPVDATAIRAVRPNARLFQFTEAGHFLMIDAPAAFNDLRATEARLASGAITRL